MLRGRRMVTVLYRVMLFAPFVSPAWAEESESFPLTEASVFDDSDDAATSSRLGLMRMQAAENRGAQCGTAPLPGVTCPALRSRTPLYGCLDLSPAPDDKLYFVVDESQPAENSPADAGQTPPSGAGPEKAVSGGAKYDVLYVDINGDRDLTNDPPLGPVKDRPKMFAQGLSNRSVVLFEYFDIKPLADSGPSVRVLPWLNLMENRAAYLIVMTASVRTGRIRIGDTSYEAMLGTPLRGPVVRMMITPVPSGPASPDAQARSRMLALGMHQAKGDFFEIAVTPAMDRITVAPYRGEMGQFRVDPGARDVQQFGAAGLLQSRTGSNVWLGEPENYYSEERPRECRLPAGDYRPSYLTVAIGDLLVRLSANPQRMQVVGDAATDASAFPIAIRSDKPYALGFAPQPTLIFTSPAPNANPEFRRGSVIAIKALLLDPSLDCIVRGLDDTTKKTGERPYSSAGERRTIPVYASLVPRVSIANAAGKEVASGTMPFG